MKTKSSAPHDIDDLETPIHTAMLLAGALEKLIAQTNILDDLSEGERQTVMETLAQRLVRETQAVHETYYKLWKENRPPLKAVTSP